MTLRMNTVLSIIGATAIVAAVSTSADAAHAGATRAASQAVEQSVDTSGFKLVQDKKYPSMEKGSSGDPSLKYPGGNAPKTPVLDGSGEPPEMKKKKKFPVVEGTSDDPSFKKAGQGSKGTTDAMGKPYQPQPNQKTKFPKVEGTADDPSFKKVK